MQPNLAQKPPTISSSLYRAFIQPQNTLILHSAGLQVLPSLAQSLYSLKSHLTILIDFPPIEVQQLNYYLQEIKQERIILQDDTRSDKPQIVMLNKVVREKRKKCYINGGIYAQTTQVMLLDCLSDTNDLNVGYISRLIIRDGDYEASDKYGLIVWLATLVSLNRNKTIMTVVSNRVRMFKGDNLERIMRLLYLKKLVVWPFGRSQIHKALQYCPVSNINHKLNLNPTEASLHQYLVQLLRYCEKSPFDKQNIEYICSCLLNYSKLHYLFRLQQLIDGSSDYSIWRSSNTNVIEIVDKIIRMSRNCVISQILIHPQQELKEQTGEQLLQKQQHFRIIDLSTLIPQKQTALNANDGLVSKATQIETTDHIQKIPYNLLYQLNVPGLQKLQPQDSGLYSTKLMEILKEVKTHCAQLCSMANQRQMGEPPEQVQIESMICQSLQRGLTKEEKPKQDKGQRSNQILNQIEQQDRSQKIIASQEQEQPQNTNNIDFSTYRFDKNTLQPRCSSPKKQQTQIIPDKIQSQLQNEGEGLKIEFKQVRVGQDRRQIQETMYISTSSKQMSKSLHYCIFCYEHNTHYIAYIRKLYHYLDKKVEERIAAIRKTIKRISSPSTKSNMMLHLEQEPILLQELYLELKSVNQLVETYLALKEDRLQRDYLFNKQLDRLELRYVNKNEIRLTTKEYSPLDDCVLTVPADRKCRVRFCIQENSSISQLTQNLRILAPHQVFFYVPNTSYIRHLNIAYSQELLVGTQKIHTLYFNNSIESEKVIKAVKEEDECFWGIGQERKKLGQYIENPEVRIKQLVIDDEIQKKSKMMSMAAATQAKNSRNQLAYISTMESIKVDRVVLIDKRQFKSLLPSYLFHHGFRVVPLFLENADYILSNEIGVQKKSVHTRDLHESLKSGRLHEQIKRLCSKFAKPYLLIECPDLSYFKKEEFSSSYNRVSGEKYTLNIRKQLIQLFYKFPKVNVIWSTGYMDTVKYFIELKKNKEEPDVNKFRPQGEQGQLQILEENQKQNISNESPQLI